MELSKLDLYMVYSPQLREQKETLRSISESLGLCYYACNLERISARPCARYQLKKCSGLCAGIISVATHNQRLIEGFQAFALKVWPYPGPIALQDDASDNSANNLLIVDQWRVLGSGKVHDTTAVITDAHTEPLDRDSYQYLVDTLLRKKMNVHILQLSTIKYAWAYFKRDLFA